MNLEELVPPLELCKLIPQGEFADSVLVRIGNSKIIALRRRAKVIFAESVHHPAPTLQEIMAELPAETICGKDHHADWFISNRQIGCIDDTERKGVTTVALRLWLMVKGAEV